MAFQEIQVLREKTGGVLATAISTSFAAYSRSWSGLDDPALIILGRLDGGQFVELDRASGLGHSLVFHDERTLVCGGNRNITVFDVSAGALTRRGELRGHTETIRALAVHGDWLASGADDKSVRVWSMTTRKLVHVLAGHMDWVRAVAFSHDGRWLASASDDKHVFVYGIPAFALRTKIYVRDWVRAICFSPDDLLLAVGSDGGCSALYGVGGAFERRRALAGGHDVLCAAWLGAAHLVGGTARGELIVWRAATGGVASRQTAHGELCSSVSAARAASALVLTASRDQTARVFDASRVRAASDTAALYRASLHVFRCLRRTDVGALVMQLIAEALAAPLLALSEPERTRIFTASRVTGAVRKARLATLAALGDFHARMHWLRTSTPVYASSELAPLGKQTYRTVAEPQLSSARRSTCKKAHKK